MDDAEEAATRFGVLFDAHVRAVLGYAVRRVAQPADAADVVADTFLVAWRRLDAIPPGEDERPWLFGVARRVLANHRRGGCRRHGLADRLRDQLVAAGPALRADTAETVAQTDAVRRALHALDADDREILRLTAWEGLTPGEIARAMDLPAATVRSRLHRARARLRAQLVRTEQHLSDSGQRPDPAGHVGGDGRPPVTKGAMPR